MTRPPLDQVFNKLVAAVAQEINRRLVACDRCGMIFVRAPQAVRRQPGELYCSPTCRHTAHKRRYRARKQGTP